MPKTRPQRSRRNFGSTLNELVWGIGAFKDFLIDLWSAIDDIEYRLSRLDKLPYPPRDSNGELRYDIFEIDRDKKQK